MGKFAHMTSPAVVRDRGMSLAVVCYAMSEVFSRWMNNILS